jgi:septation ring formation regulator EzrA
MANNNAKNVDLTLQKGNALKERVKSLVENSKANNDRLSVINGLVAKLGEIISNLHPRLLPNVPGNCKELVDHHKSIIEELTENLTGKEQEIKALKESSTNIANVLTDLDESINDYNKQDGLSDTIKQLTTVVGQLDDILPGKKKYEGGGKSRRRKYKKNKTRKKVKNV